MKTELEIYGSKEELISVCKIMRKGIIDLMTGDKSRKSFLDLYWEFEGFLLEHDYDNVSNGDTDETINKINTNFCNPMNIGYIDHSVEQQKTKSLLYTIYNAGFEHGSNEGSCPEHGTVEAFQRLIIGESPMNDRHSYDIKDQIDALLFKA